MSAFEPLPPVSMRRALEDPNLLGRVMVGESWRPWRILLIAMMGEELTDDERSIFAKLTGRSREPLQRVEEFWCISGRRGGKSFAMAMLIVYLAVFVSYQHVLTFGEQPVVLCLSQTQDQSRVVFNYVVGIFAAIPLLAPLVRQRIAETLSLRNGIDIQIRAASFRGLRGVTCVAAIADEVAFWFADDTSANPDVEILGALRPSLATTNGILIAITTPYARRGAAYETWSENFGAKGDPLILVAQGSTRDFNESFSQRKVDRELERDPAFARAEYLGQWRDDVAAYVSREIVDALVERGVAMRPPSLGKRWHVAFTDPAGGSGSDSFTLAIAHRENDQGGPRYVLDCLLERKPPFGPDANCHKVTGDKWAQGFPPESFKRHGVSYEVSEKTKSDLYSTALPLLTSGLASLLDDKRLISQLTALERRTSRGGKDSIDHPSSGHDDVANAAMGALVQAMGRQPMQISDAALALAGSDTRYARQLRDVARLQRGEIDDIPAAWL